MQRSLSSRTVYQNQQQTKKEPHTIFHSPYKNGRPNPQFSNPSFMSSALLYGDNIKTNNVVEACIPNHNQTTKARLYKQRMQKQQGFHFQIHSTSNHPQNVHPQKKRFRINTKQNQLQHQLFQLKDYRKHVSKTTQQAKIEEIPFYFDKNKPKIEKQQKDKQRKELSNWYEASNELKELKNSVRKELHYQQSENVKRSINHFHEQVKNKDKKIKKNAVLLANILQEQIESKKQRRF